MWEEIGGSTEKFNNEQQHVKGRKEAKEMTAVFSRNQAYFLRSI
jgi:hypothetical protein